MKIGECSRKTVAEDISNGISKLTRTVQEKCDQKSHWQLVGWSVICLTITANYYLLSLKISDNFICELPGLFEIIKRGLCFIFKIVKNSPSTCTMTSKNMMLMFTNRITIVTVRGTNARDYKKLA